MNVYLEKPYSINEIGERLNNEDALFPHNEEVSANHRLFIVCDGVGGSKKGEIASALACESIRSYFKSFIHPQQEFRTDFIKKAVYYTEICFDEYLMENPSSKGMATTLSMLYIAPNGVFIAHAGDCRVYHIRNGKILYQTEDHSLVNSLVKTGRIQPAEAENHPQKNVVLRAIQGSAYPVEIDVHHIQDVQPGDQFFLCTDGLLEVMSDQMICDVLFKKTNAQHKINQILNLCYGKTKDNYSALLIPVHEVQKAKTFNQIFASFLSAFM